MFDVICVYKLNKTLHRFCEGLDFYESNLHTLSYCSVAKLRAWVFVVARRKYSHYYINKSGDTLGLIEC